MVIIINIECEGMFLILLMQKAVIDRNDLHCIYFMYILRFGNIKLTLSCIWSGSNINLMPTVDVNLMSTIDVTNPFIFDRWLMSTADATKHFIFDRWLMSTADVTKTFHFWPMVDGQLNSTVDIILMSIENLLPTWRTSYVTCPRVYQHTENYL